MKGGIWGCIDVAMQEGTLGCRLFFLLVKANIIAIGSPFLSCAPQAHRFSHSPLALGKQPLRPAFSCLSPKVNVLSSLDHD